MEATNQRAHIPHIICQSRCDKLEWELLSMGLSMASISLPMDSTPVEFCAVETRLARPSPTNFNDTANVQPFKRKSSSWFH
jgi:hypothetical protein